MTRLLLTILTGLLGCINLHAQSINFNGISLFEITSSDFVCVPGAYNTIGNATTAGNCINMTSGGFEAGAVWICDGIDLNQNFKVSFNANFGTNISTGDGIAFLLQQEALPNIIGGRGGGLGYAVGDGVGCQSGACPIEPSVAVEFDTYDGSAWFDNDLPCNHMSIQIDGSTGAAATVEGPSCLLPSGASVLDGLNHEICITWEPSVLEYKIYFDGVQIGEFNGDIRPYFPNPSDVWWGFTAASGGAPQNQSVCNIVMETNISNPTCICSSSMTVTSNSNPSTCNGTNGSLIIGGLDPNATYSLTYDLDGINNGPLSITTNSSGEYLLFGLGDGSYTNFDAELLGCVSSVTGPIILTQPSPPVLVINDPAARCAPGSVDLTDPSVTAGSTGSGTLTYWQNSGASTPLSNPNSVNTTGTYYIQSDNGCEDIEAVNVTINPSPVLDVPIPFSTTICSGESPDVTPTANIPGSTFSWSTSSSSVNLSGFSNFGSGNINENISNSGNTTESVTYTILPTSPSPASCDGSSANYVVYVLPSEASVDVQVSCTSYTWIDGNTYTSSNNSATVVLSNTAGCDSTVTLDLTITNSNTGTDVITSCDSYTWIDGTTYTSSNNTATVVLSNTAGCDSTVTLDLTITNSNTGTDVITSCDSYTWIDGNTYTSSNNSATLMLSNTNGCDSLVTLDLTINNSYSTTDNHGACDSYTWIDGNTYTTSNNTATVMLTSISGCDSLVTLDLIIDNSLTGTDVITACDSYTWIDGTTYTSSNNSATILLTASGGCDSLVTLNLTLGNSNTGTDVITSCDSYTWIDGTTYTSSNNSATVVLSNASGCDSTVTLDLTITNSNTGTDVITSCDSYTWIDGVTYTSSNNSATVVLSNTAGCDSTVTLDLTITNSNTGTDVITSCDSYTWINGTTYTSSNNSATVVLSNTAGCDSTVTLDLTITNSNTGTDVITSCDSYTWIDGTTYTASNNSATVVLSNAAGCDSTVTLDLTINNTPSFTLAGTDPSVCNASDGVITLSGLNANTSYVLDYDSLSFTSQQINIITDATGNYLLTGLSAGEYANFSMTYNGCTFTSLDVMDLNNPGAPIIDAQSNVVECDTYTLGDITGVNLSGNEGYYTESNGGGIQLNSGEIISTSQTIYIYDILGTCADESDFTVTINNTPSIINPGPQEVCESYFLPLSISGTNLSGNENYYTDLQSNGGTVIIDAITSSQTVYIYDENGACSNEVSFEITINSLPSLVSFTGEGEYCDGDVINDLIAEVSGTADYTLEYTLDGNLLSISSSNSSISLGNSPGIYTLSSLNDNACGISLNETQVIVVNSTPDSPMLDEDATYCSNTLPESIQATGSTGTYTWYSDESLNDFIGTEQSYTPNVEIGSVTYYVTATENGCEGIPAEVTITFENCEILIPTAFTPDGDQINDTWILGNIDDVYPNNIVSVYNRLGNKVYESDQGAYSDRPWGGEYNGTILPVASYYYVIEYNDDTSENINGTVSIIK